MSGESHRTASIPGRLVDLGERPQIERLTSMLREGSKLEDPARMLAHFGAIFGIGQGPKRDVLVTVSTRGLPEGRYKITRMLNESEVLNPNNGNLPNPWAEWDRLAEYEGGFLGELISIGSPQLIRGLDLSHDPVVGRRLAGMRSCMATPHFDEGRALNWAIQFATDDDRWSAEDVERTMVMGNLLGTATRNLVTRRSVDELNRKLEAQLDEVAKVQRSLLPNRTPDIPGLKIATSYLTSERAGGDYYDFVRFDEARWGIMIADVSGHGAAAATVMAMLHAFLHGLPKEHMTPAQSVAQINARLYQSLREGMFVTAMFMLYDNRSGEVDFVLCGHPPARVRRADGRVEALEGTALLPMGIVEPYDLASTHARLHPGDTLVMYTDGITEAPRMTPEGKRDMFGAQRLDDALRECTGQPSCVIDSVHQALYRHVGSMTREDDQTLVVLRREERA
ncbi:MAG: PP2C family protein-serine/threonine phosphatase [Phycisphaerales bacterium JB059]